MLKRLVINTFEGLGVLKASRYLHRHQPMILMYHRVVDHPLLPGIPPEIFQAQMRYLKKHFRVIAIEQLVEELKTDSLQPYTAAVTFDDGHQDFYTNAWPVLQKYEIPAALYITTSFIDQQKMLWPDQLRYLLINSREQQLILGGLGSFSLLSDQEKLYTWNLLGNYCLTLDSEQRVTFLENLARQAQIEWDNKAQSPFLPVSWQQIQEMQAGGLSIGSHTVSHPILSKLTNEKIQEELLLSSQLIQEKTGIPPAGICYPNGMAADISAEVVRQAADIYNYGLVAFPSQVCSTNLMQLGRKAAPKTLWQFKQILNNMNFYENSAGHYQ